MIGTGPFKLDHWTVNQELVVTKNPDYWQKDANGTQLPYLDKITFKPVAEAAQRVNGFKGGQLDVIHTSERAADRRSCSRSPSQYNLMQEKPGRREVRYYLMNTSKAPLDDPNARDGGRHGHRPQPDQPGHATPATTRSPTGRSTRTCTGYLKNPGYPKFNLKKATSSPTAYKAAHGGQFTVVLEHTNDPANAEEAAAHPAAARQGRHRRHAEERGPDRVHHQRGHAELQHHALAQPPRRGPRRPVPMVDEHREHACSTSASSTTPTLQTLLDQGRSEPDQAKRTQIYQQVNQEFSKQVFNVWGYYIQWLIAAQKNVQGLAGPPLPDKGGNPLFIYGRHPLLGIYLTK